MKVKGQEKHGAAIILDKFSKCLNEIKKEGIDAGFASYLIGGICVQFLKNKISEEQLRDLLKGYVLYDTEPKNQYSNFLK